MIDLSALTDLEVYAGTLLGESESLGQHGMEGTALTILNRVNANLKWLGGDTIRGVCLQPKQYQCWDGNDNTDRILNIIANNPLYGPFIVALTVATDATNGNLTDWTNQAVSYFDPPSDPWWAKDKTPCLVDGKRTYFNLAAIV